jgi:hypothetical protein
MLPGIPDEAAGRSDRTGLAGPDRGDAVVAVTDLFRDHHIELVRLALIMVGDLATAEDVVQDAFERLHRGWHNLRQPSSGLAYLRSCVLNGCRSVHRRAAVARKLGPRLAGPQEGGCPGGASAADDRGEMAAALRVLPRRQREVLTPTWTWLRSPPRCGSPRARSALPTAAGWPRSPALSGRTD